MHRKRFITNTVFLFITGLATQVIGLLILPLFVENLGKEMYGLFIISGILVGYVNLLDLGFTDGLTRQIGRAYVSDDSQEFSNTVSTGFWLFLGVGIAAGTVIYLGRFVFIDFFHIEGADRVIAEKLLVVAAVFSVLDWPMKLPHEILRGILRIKEISIVQASSNIVSSVLILGLVLIHIDIVGIRIGVCLVIFCSWLVKILLVRHYIPDQKWRLFHFNMGVWRKMFGFSLAIFYSRLISMFSIRIDYFIIGNMMGVAPVTNYIVSSKIFESIRNNTGKLFGALIPTVFSLDNTQDRHKLQTLLDEGVRYRAILITPLAYLGIIISPPFIQIWMGPEYTGYAIWSQLFMIVHLISVFGIGTNIARGMGRLKVVNLLLTIRIALNLALSIMLLPYFGIGGPIMGTLFAQIVFGDVFTFPYFAKICKLKHSKALHTGLSIILINVPTTVLSLFIIHHIRIDSWIRLVITATFLVFILYGTLFVIYVRKEEKRDFMYALDAIGFCKVPRIRNFITRCLGI